MSVKAREIRDGLLALERSRQNDEDRSKAHRASPELTLQILVYKIKEFWVYLERDQRKQEARNQSDQKTLLRMIHQLMVCATPDQFVGEWRERLTRKHDETRAALERSRQNDTDRRKAYRALLERTLQVLGDKINELWVYLERDQREQDAKSQLYKQQLLLMNHQDRILEDKKCEGVLSALSGFKRKREDDDGSPLRVPPSKSNRPNETIDDTLAAPTSRVRFPNATDSKPSAAEAERIAMLEEENRKLRAMLLDKS